MSKQMIAFCFLSALAGSGVGIGVSATSSNVYQNRELSALEERVEELEAKESTCAEKHRKGFKKIGKHWWPPIPRGIETTNPNALANKTKDEVKEAGLSSIDQEMCLRGCVLDKGLPPEHEHFHLVTQGCWETCWFGDEP